MKRFALTLTILCAACALTWAGTESYSGKDKEVIQQAPAPCEWYRAHEWDLDVWGTYAFPGNTGKRDARRSGDFGDDDRTDSDTDADEHVDLGLFGNDKFINRDDALGGGADIKYFFNKYLGIGVEGFVLDTNDNIGGAALGTFTVRYPIGCSRFAPYAFGGVGVLGGGSHTNWQFNEVHQGPNNANEDEFINKQTTQNKHAEAIGQVGGGLEIRLTHHIGLMGDFAWNFVSGPDNDFGMARAGVTFSY
jgi:hypothetical protein